MDKLKSDKYKKSRGGYSRLLAISCAGCGDFLTFYQKDGPGSLKRMYLDRFYQAPDYSDLASKPINLWPKLICKKCGRFLGVPMVYEKEKRLAFRLFPGAVIKKIVKSDHI
jgi:ribosomal protein S27E